MDLMKDIVLFKDEEELDYWPVCLWKLSGFCCTLGWIWFQEDTLWEWGTSRLEWISHRGTGQKTVNFIRHIDYHFDIRFEIKAENNELMLLFPIRQREEWTCGLEGQHRDCFPTQVGWLLLHWRDTRDFRSRAGGCSLIRLSPPIDSRASVYN